MNISLAQTYHIDKKHIAVKPSFNYGLANKHFSNFQGQFKDKQNYAAFKSIEGALTNRPGYSEYLKEKAYLLQRLGYSDDALKLYQQSIKYRKRNDIVQVTSHFIANMRKPGYHIHMESSHSTSTHLMSNKSSSGKPHRIKRMMVIAGIALAFAMASNPINAQTLKMQLIESNSNPAKGTIIVTSSDTVITDSAFEGEATYILNTATSTDMLTAGALRLYPNPAGQSVTLEVPQGSIGRLEVHDFTGKLLGAAPQGSSSVVVPVSTGVVLLTWKDQNGQQSLRLVCRAKTIRIHINAGENRVVTLKSELADSDDYTIDFSDPTENIEDVQWNRTIHLGENITINETIEYTIKDLITQFSGIGTNVNLNVDGIPGTTDANGNAEITLQERISREDSILVNIMYNGENVEEENYDKWIKTGTNQETKHANKIYKNKTNATSGKGANIVITDIHGNPLSSGQVGEEILFNKRTDEQEIIKKINKENYIEQTKNQTVHPGLTTETITLIGKYTARINNTKENANITWKDEEENTILTGTNETQIYQELAQDENTIKAIIEYTNYINDTIKFENNIAGITEINAEQMIGKYTAKINNAQTGTNITWKDENENTIITGQDIIELYQELQQDSANIQAILEKTGYKNDTIQFTNIKPGITEKNAEQEEKTYEHTINIQLTNNDEKTETRFRGYAIINEDTVAVENFTGTNGTLQFTNTQETLEAKIGAKNIPNFQGEEKTQTITTGNNNTTITTNAIEYFYNITGNIQHETQGPAKAKITFENKNDSTDTNGDYEITNIKEERGTNNEAITPYTREASVSGEFTTENKNVSVDGTNKIVNFVVDDKAYQINITGKAINGPATERIKNINEAIILENASGEKFYLDLDANGEFNTNINVADLNEKIKIYTNATAIPEYSKTFSIIKHNEEYPINRGLGEDYSTCDWTNPADTTVNITANLLDDDYLRISIAEKKLTESPNIQFAMKDGSLKYEPTTPIQPFVWTIDRGTGLPITTEQQQMYEEQMTKAITYTNLPEIETGIPINPIQSSTTLPQQTGAQIIYQWNATADGNGTYQGSEIGYIKGSEAHTQIIITPQSTLIEIMSKYFNPGAGGIEEDYCLTWNSDSTAATGTTDEGKFEINFQDNWEPLSGKTAATAFNSLTKEALENKNYLTAQRFINASLENKVGNKDALMNQAVLLQAIGKGDEAMNFYHRAKDQI